MIKLIRGLFRWLGTPVRALQLPEARQAMIYLIFAGAGPALTVIVIWSMRESLARQALWSTFSNLAYMVAAGMLIIVCGLGMFVSIRAVKIGKDGFQAQGGFEGPPAVEDDHRPERDYGRERGRDYGPWEREDRQRYDHSEMFDNDERG